MALAELDRMEAFIGSSNRSLKAALLHNENKFSSIPVGHSVAMNESHRTMECVLSLLNYEEHQRLICGDLKVVWLILGLQSGHTQYSGFMCFWDSLADIQHYDKQEWPARQELNRTRVTQRSVRPFSWSEQGIDSTPTH